MTRAWGLALAATGILGLAALVVVSLMPPTKKTSQPRTLESYREEFRKPDGSLPTDAELEAILIAKGIPYVQQVACSAKACENNKNANRAALPKVEFQSQSIPPSEQPLLQEKIHALLSHQIEQLRAHAPQLSLEKIVVDNRLKLLLYFNQDFSVIADEETLLNDFSESLHALGDTPLRGSAFFIKGIPLGEYLKKRDAERDREAREASPLPAPASVR
ncbi:MAG: hypothetical protein N2Z22_10780 [Turneriella sp.]|nr:hypothetical protein [Turneriella sp.]